MKLTLSKLFSIIQENILYCADNRVIILQRLMNMGGADMDIGWITPGEAGNKWGIKERRVQAMCSKGQISGVVRKGRMWLIPINTPKPIDGRTKIARSIKEKEEA